MIPNIPVSEIYLLTNNKTQITSLELYEILQKYQKVSFDPVKSVFSLLDKNHTGEIDLDNLLELVKTFGLKKIDDSDRKIVLECLDLDKDGKIGFEDL